jgi:hypothetical protein
MSKPNYTPTANVDIPESKLLSYFIKHVDKSKEILQNLDQILKDFEIYDGYRFAAKVAGTTASVVGAIELVSALFTDEWSLTLTWMGGVAVVSGFIINGATEITNYYVSKETIDKVIRLAATRDSYVNKEQKVLENLMKYAELIKIRENLTNDQAIGKAMNEHMNADITFSDSCGSLGITQPTEALADIPNPSQQTKHGIADAAVISIGESAGVVHFLYIHEKIYKFTHKI